LADQRRISRQEQILDEAQKRLERLERARELMIQQVEREAQILADMQKDQEDFTRGSQNLGTTPSLSASAPATFKSQFEQFNTTPNVDRLKVIGNEGVSFTIGKLEVNKGTESTYHHSDRSEHWTNLTENPGKPIYASGEFISTEHGSYQIDSTKEYEYEVSARALPISVGDVVRVPVHPTGHGGGAFTTSYLQMRINSLYSEPKFFAYHDRIEG